VKLILIYSEFLYTKLQPTRHNNSNWDTNISEYPFEYDAYFDDDVILSSNASMMAADAKIEEFTWQCWPGYYNVLYYFQ